MRTFEHDKDLVVHLMEHRHLKSTDQAETPLAASTSIKPNRGYISRLQTPQSPPTPLGSDKERAGSTTPQTANASVATLFSEVLQKIDSCTREKDSVMEVAARRDERVQTSLRSRVSRLLQERNVAVGDLETAQSEMSVLEKKTLDQELIIKGQRSFIEEFQSRLTKLVAEKDEAIKLRDVTIKESKPSTGDMVHLSLEPNKPFHLTTKAFIMAEDERIKQAPIIVDSSQLFNFIPDSLVLKLGLKSQLGNKSVFNIGGRLVSSNQYCRFEIEVAGVSASINAAVVSSIERSSIQLGRIWIAMVNLLGDFENCKYYIPDAKGNLLKLPIAIQDEIDVESYWSAQTDGERSALGDGRDEEHDDLYEAGYVDVKFAESEVEMGGNAVDMVDDESFVEPVENEVEMLDCEVEIIGLDNCVATETENFDEFQSTEQLATDKEVNKNRLDTIEVDIGTNHKTSFSATRICAVERILAARPRDDEIHSGAISLKERDGYNLREKTDRPEYSSISRIQSDSILKAVTRVRRTQAGAYFTAPVTHLWPEVADAYTEKISHPIDLAVIERKLNLRSYASIETLRDEIHLLHSNALEYNGSEDTVTKAALKVRDNLLAAILKCT